MALKKLIINFYFDTDADFLILVFEFELDFNSIFFTLSLLDFFTINFSSQFLCKSTNLILPKQQEVFGLDYLKNMITTQNIKTWI